MDWKPDREDKKPIYKQIAEYIEQGIGTGQFPADRVLPSERTLAKELNVNRSTVVSAYEELQSLGIVERKKGSGTSVSTDIWGISHKRIPNWGRYVEDGSFLPSLPLVQRIRSEIQNNHLVNLASGELSPELMPDDQFKNILSSQVFNGKLGYDHPHGNEDLRNTLVSHVKETKKIDTDSSSILITSGAQQALHLIVECLLKPGDAVAIEDPSYSYSLPVFQSAGLRTFLLPVDKNGANPEDLLALHKKHRIRMVFLNPEYQNPTGTILSLSRRKRFLEISSEFGIPIIEDDPYSLTSYNGKVNATLKSLDTNGNVLYISSLSKIVASGLRIGWIIGPPQVIQRLADGKQQVDFGHSVFPQWIANEFLRSTYFTSHINIVRKELMHRRDELILSLKEIMGEQIDFLTPEGGIHLWCKVNPSINEHKLLEESIKNGVAFVPGSILGSKKGFIRFTYGRGQLGMIREGVLRFAESLNHLKLDG
ncbi:GntR family transcriptional regulator [Bacillus sp. SA1-12]|uniref:MocR-like pyridoxine biosynthesis transcription factor PdxR n=1 Tax=Bacillus sp. SA1-12 TaxID=1455638 RepID=UPI0006255C03|nr:PLP-dependent aminotransferase family protein [Bacillus sp. SA1-12]KKI92411.1 GntR family transcriptional regulator [Bacillus sp. SA1-12]